MIPNLRREQRALKAQLASQECGLEEALEKQDRLDEVRKELVRRRRARTDYLLDTCPDVFDYFEQKKQIDQGRGEKTVLDAFFKTGDSLGSRARPGTSALPDICTSCGQGEMIPSESDGVLVCTSCAAGRRYLVENDKPSYKEPPKEVCFYAYKRINHFREILAQFQAKETTQIPSEVLDAVKHQVRKERISLQQLTNRKAKDILKKLGYNKYYEHIPFIKDKLGIKPPIMTSELEETLCRLFMEIQAPYAKYCPDDRVNFLNYYYTVYKLCELLDQNQFLPFFPMLKDREKRIEQDEIWKKICDELGWEFVPTV